MTTIFAPAAATCSACGFSTSDLHLLAGHSCAVQSFGGRCEDFPCCGHEAGDCNGMLYGSDEAIKAEAYAHAYCDHEAGHYACEDNDGGECLGFDPWHDLPEFCQNCDCPEDEH